MSQGLGRTQRLLLFQLARTELTLAEQAARKQTVYRPPTYCELIMMFRAMEAELDLTLPACAGRKRRRGFGGLDSFWFNDRNPSRTLQGLVNRGYVSQIPNVKLENIALTKAGFIEACRLGGVPPSELAERLVARWH